VELPEVLRVEVLRVELPEVLRVEVLRVELPEVLRVEVLRVEAVQILLELWGMEGVGYWVCYQDQELADAVGLIFF